MSDPFVQTGPQAVFGTFIVPRKSGLRRAATLSVFLGVVALAASVSLGWGSKQFFASYLVAYLYFLSIALGGLFFVIIQFASRAGWSVVVRRIAENAMVTLPVFALLFVPVALGVHDLYHWSHPEAVAADPLLQHKAPYLNERGYYARAVLYFLVWSAIAWIFYRRSVDQDRSGELRATRTMQRLSGPAIAAFAFSVTFAAFDWLMSLDPHWYSTMFGVYYFAGAVVAIFAFITLMGILLQRIGLLTEVITTEHYHDLGKLLFAFTVFWAYIAFSQFMLIWYANIPEETVWYAHRAKGWLPVSVLLGVGHFAVPFFFLLPRSVKRRRAPLVAAAVWLSFMHYVDLHWLVMPTFHHKGPDLSYLDLLTFVGIGAIFFGLWAWLSCRQALLPSGDPRIGESVDFENI